jgi:prepilin-type N-terminal cleavage/methylation domain-containing protein
MLAGTGPALTTAQNSGSMHGGVHTGERPVATRSGFTLIETLMVIVVVSLCALIALPKFGQAVATSNLGSAKNKLTTLYGSARASAAGRGQTAYLHLSGNQIYVTATPRRGLPLGANTQDTLTPLENIYTQYGVMVTPSADSLRIDPAGMGRDSAVVVLSKGSQTTTVRISQFGRILK